MIAFLQVASRFTGRSRPSRSFNQSSRPRWVPVNKSFISLVKTILGSASERLGLEHLALTLRCLNHQGSRHLLLAQDEPDLLIAASGGSEEFIISTQAPNRSPFYDVDAEALLSLPVNFRTPEPQRLGYLVAQLTPGTELLPAEIKQELEQVVGDIVRVISRYQSRYRSVHWYGDANYWIGTSNALRQLDQRIDQLAKGTAPVLIRADKGTGKVIAARRLHDLRCGGNAPFIESDCREWEQGNAPAILQSLGSCALGGSIFLRNLDCLSERDSSVLRHFCLQWMASQAGEGERVTLLVFSLSRAEPEPAALGLGWLAHFAQQLRLPNLSERGEDLRALVQFFTEQLALPSPLEWSESVWPILESQLFPEQVESLKQLIKRLADQAQGLPICAERLRSLL